MYAMIQLRKKLVLSLTATLAGVCGVLCFFIVFVYKHDVTTCCVSVPVFFLLIGIISILLITKNGNTPKKNGNGTKNGRKRANKYMLIRTIKIFLGGIFFLLYWYIIDPEDIVGFAMTFAVFYLAYLAFEAWSFLQVEKKIKNNVQQSS